MFDEKPPKTKGQWLRYIQSLTDEDAVYLWSFVPADEGLPGKAWDLASDLIEARVAAIPDAVREEIYERFHNNPNINVIDR